MPAAGLLKPASVRHARRREGGALRPVYRGPVCEGFREAVPRAKLQKAPELRDPDPQVGGVLPAARQGRNGGPPHQAVLSSRLRRARRVWREGHDKPRVLFDTRQGWHDQALYRYKRCAA